MIVEQPLKENGELVINKKGEKKPDSSKRDSERVPLFEDIDRYFEREVKPNLEHAWMDRSKDKVGYEINFTKYFFKFKPLRSIDETKKELLEIDIEIKKLEEDIF